MNSPQLYIPPKVSDNHTLEQIVLADPPSVKRYAIKNGIFKATAEIALVITELQQQVHVDKGMDKNNIAIASNIVYSQFGDLSLEDIILCFKLGLAGEYGSVWDRLDVTILTRWLKLYRSNKADRSEQIRNSFKPISKLPPAPLTDEQKAKIEFYKAEIKKKLANATDKFTQPERKKVERKPLPQEEHDHMIFEIFDGLHKEQDYPVNANKQRVIQYQGKELTQEEFLKQSYDDYSN